MSHLVDAEKVHQVFDAWVEDLLEHHANSTISRVLGSPAIQAAFLGDVDQFCGPDD